jgi:hypothetical protein
MHEGEKLPRFTPPVAASPSFITLRIVAP